MVETRRLRDLADRAGPRLDLPTGPLVVALSGGADSAALAYLIRSAARPVRAIHVDHGLEASPRLAEAAGDIANSLRIDISILGIEIPPGSSPEARAREARYQAIRGALSPGEWALTAHTLDDQAETILMNLLRGTGPSGLRGIPTRNGWVARPLLSISRSETREIATLAGLAYLDDPTNTDLTIRRNEIRLHVLPDLAGRFNPRLAESLARASSLLEADEEYLDGLAGRILFLTGHGSTAVSVGELVSAPSAVADRVVRRMLATVRPPHGGEHREVAEIWRVARGDRSRAVLAGGIEVVREGPLLVVGAADEGFSGPIETPLSTGVNRLGLYELDVVESDGPCRVAPTGATWAIFSRDAQLVARIDRKGHLSVEADGQLAWVPWESRKGVAWYQPGSSGYLSVFAREDSGWTSSP
jgi:tRNA(Ile)-lysidine synthase